MDFCVESEAPVHPHVRGDNPLGAIPLLGLLSRVTRNDNSLGRCMPTTGIALFLLTGKGCGLYSDARIWSRTSTRNHFGLVEHIDRLDLVDRDGRTTIR